MTDNPMTGKERRERANQLRDQGAATLATQEGYQRYLGVLGQHLERSAKNCLMILAQMPEAAILKSFDGWKALGRSVKKGEKSIVISGGDYREPAEGGAKRFFTKDVFLFDVSQTEGEDEVLEALGPEPVIDPVGVMARVDAFVRERYQIQDGAPANGCNPREKIIQLASHATPTKRCIALVRQFAKCRSDYAVKGDPAATETVADGVAWIFANRLGLDFAMAELAFAHLAVVIADPELRDEVLDQTRRVAGWIEKACVSDSAGASSDQSEAA